MDSIMNGTTLRDKTVSIVGPDKQRKLIRQAFINCHARGLDANDSLRDDGQCSIAWDGLMCWGPTPPGTIARKSCPDYINGLNRREFATRHCLEDGTWFINRQTNKSWSNYTDCTKRHSQFTSIAEHIPNIQVMYKIGYGLSLGSLIIAVIIMLCCKRLKCKSNTLHINLFFAFIFRSFITILKDGIIVHGLGLEKDVKYSPEGQVEFIQEGTHWECKLLFSVFHYCIGASYMWIFMEGLYLHMLVYKTLFTERHGVRFYMIFGWTLPFTFLIPWIIVRSTLDDTLCWNTQTVAGYYWIMKGPIVASILINFLFFLDILRVLCLRVRANQHRTRRKFRKIAKFTLVLIPLFGVLYIGMIILNVAMGGKSGEYLFQLYFEMFYNSFQGFLLALLFCFLNEEVHNEIQRIWKRRRYMNADSFMSRSVRLTSLRKSSVRTQNANGLTANRFVSSRKGPVITNNSDNAKSAPLIHHHHHHSPSLDSDKEDDSTYNFTDTPTSPVSHYV